MSEITQTAATTEAKTTKKKGPKPAAKSKALAPKAKPAKAAKPTPEKRPRAPRESRTDWQTFAFRMPKAESAALHRAAGPANASRVMRALAGAFVSGDRAVFESIIEDARKLLA